jgi:hypothetical protein
MSSNKDYAMQAPGVEGVKADHPAAAHLEIVDAATATVKTDRKKWAVCGFASSSRHRMPIDDPEWVIMAMNQLYRHIPRLDVEWDIHRNWNEDNVPGTDHAWWLSQCGIPVVMVERQASIPTSMTFPIDRLREKFSDYFTSTVAFMLAWTIDHIDREVEARMATMDAPASLLEAHARAQSLYAEYTIGVFGIDMIVGTEYDVQKACVEFYLGQASSRGIVVQLPPETALLKQQYRYGYEKEPASLLGILEMEQRAGSIQARIQTIQSELRTLDGALQECGYHVDLAKLRSRGGEIPMGLMTTT